MGVCVGRAEGDRALINYTNQFDRRQVNVATELELSQQALTDALNRMDQQTSDALRSAAKRINDYHQHQVTQSWQYEEADGTVLGQRITPLDRVGLYVPGGKAAYPSSVLMSAVPAKVECGRGRQSVYGGWCAGRCSTCLRH